MTSLAFDNTSNDDDLFNSFAQKVFQDSAWDSFDQFNSENSEKDIDESINDEDLSDEDDEINNYSCVECKSFNLIYNDGLFSCGECGIMQPKKLSQEAEYRFYGSNDNRGSNPERVGMPTNSLLPETSMGSLIQHRASDNSAMKRMVQYNSWNQMPYKERSLYKICCRINNRSSRAGLPTIIIDRAKELYNIVKEVNISRGDNREGLIAACVYIACKDTGVPRSTKEIATIFDIKLQDMTRGVKFFRENWRLAKKKTDSISHDSSNPINFIDRYCSPLKISQETKHLAEYIAVKAIIENLVDDNTAPSIAAGSIFLACSVDKSTNVTKKQVADSCKTSEVTISKCYKKLNDNKHKLLPKCYSN